MVFLIIVKIENTECYNTVGDLARHLVGLGHRCIMDADMASSVSFDVIEYLDSAVCDELCDIVVSIGGDGTMLYSAQRAVSINKPVFGVNSGRLGFLCAFDALGLEEITNESIAALKLSERMLLDVSVSDKPDAHYIALNDVVVSKGSLSKTIEFYVTYGARKIAEYRSDGIIVSTPTGSTAYSLSAGGPIVSAELELVLLTPICAHSLFSRSMVFDLKDEITIAASRRNDNDAFLSVDSNVTFKLSEMSTITIKRSERKLQLLTSPSRDYFRTLRKRIAEGG